MKKFVNLRLPVIIAISLSAGLALGYIFEFYNLNRLYIIAIIPVVAVFFIVSTIFFKSYRAPIYLFIALLVTLGGTGLSLYRFDKFNTHELSNDCYYTIRGTVDEKLDYTNRSFLILKNATAVDDAFNEIKIEGKICVRLYIPYGDYAEAGYLVEFTEPVRINPTFLYGELNGDITDNIKYTCTVSNNSLLSKYRFSLFGNIRSSIHKTLYENLDADDATICYAMLTGNSYGIESAAIENFRYGGIAHIFAVSGLHIGIVFGALNFLFKKLRLNKHLSGGIIIFAIFFYAGVCGFTASALRAAVMCTVMLICKLFFLKNDSLNSLAYAAITVLLISPMSLFFAGFQLSVCAMGGIFIVSNNVSRLLSKIKCPKKLCGAIGTSVGAQLGTMPVMLAHFGYLSGAGLLLNLVFIPLFSVFFIFIFSATIFCTVFSATAAALLPLAVVPFQTILSFIISAGFEKSLITGFGAGIFVPLYFIALPIISDKLNLNSIKRIIAICTSTVLLSTFVISASVFPLNGYRVYISGMRTDGCIIIKSYGGAVMVVTQNITNEVVAKAVNKSYASNINAVIILGDEYSVTTFNGLGVDCKDIYMFKLYLNYQPYKKAEVHYEQNFRLNGINFEFTDGYNLSAEMQNKKVCISYSKDIPFEKCDLLISSYENPNCDCGYNVRYEAENFKYNNYEYGNLNFYISENGEIKLTTLLRNL